MKQFSSSHAVSTLPVLMVFMYRAFDIRFMVSARVIDHLCEDFKVVLVVPEQMIEGLKKNIPQSVIFEILKYPSQDFVIEPPKRSLPVRVARTILSMAFTLTYGNLDRKPNVTRDLHVRNFSKLIKTQRFKHKLTRGTALLMSYAGTKWRWARMGMQALYRWLTNEDAHHDLYNRHRPDMVVVCSMGQSSDGMVLCEAHRHHVTTVCVVQSWDKTSSKGYPPVTPDFVVVWSHAMADETTIYFDIPVSRVFVEGAPVWDSYFQDLPVIPRHDLMNAQGLDPSGKLIYCALNSPGYHEGNKQLLKLLSEAAMEGRFANGTQLLFRVHPGYMNNLQARNDLNAFFEESKTNTGIAFCEPKVDFHPGFYLFSSEDDQFVRSIFSAADVCLSVGSTQMIEASVFGKPAICVEYGHWKSQTMDVDFSDYKLEHRERVFRCEAIARSKNADALLDDICDAIKQPDQKDDARRKVIDQEIPINRGVAAKAIAQRLANINSTMSIG